MSAAECGASQTALARWWGRAVVLVVGCCAPLTAAAEGGYFPSLGAMAGIALVYLLLAPALITAAVYWLLKAVRWPASIRKKPIIIVAFTTWIVLSAAVWGSSLGDAFTENEAMSGSVALTFILTLASAFWRAKPGAPANKA